MIFYNVRFDDNTTQQVTLVVMGTEQYRLANGGKSNLDLLLDQLKREYPTKRPVHITRTMTGAVEYIDA